MSEQFENIIRKKLQEAEPSFDPAAWEQMKSKLDDADRRRPFWWWWAGGLLLIVGLGGWWWFAAVTDVNKSGTGGSVNNSANIRENKVPPSANPGANNNDVDKPAGRHRPYSSAPAGTANLYPQSGKNVNNPVRNSGISANINKQAGNNPVTVNPSNNSSVTHSKDVNNPVAGTEPIKNNSSSGENVNNTPNTSGVTPGNPQSGSSVPGNVNNPSTINPLPGIIPLTPTNVDNPAQKPGTVSDSAMNTEDKKKPARKKQQRGFDGGLFLGPDMNVTPAFKGMPVGITTGLIVRYHVNNRWYISSGVGYAKKLYGASPSEYSSNYPPTYYAIDANCDVIDIPLNISYTFAQGKKSSWSATAGASSYLMLKEKYEYHYPNNVKYTREYDNQNHHYFSVINLGVTWEKQTRSRLSWGLQPYVKIPVNGVGQGSVRVYSAGVTVQAILGKKKD
ncbi:outer membrane beta-barrel protein [Chitinophaga barathri]|uniref:Outer membrane protein beta-barrel domain-containing protein n=1 Tax=Chitinophaga barathri TaxID=1647451 RepID=A0A3N4M5A5_9BACT|nr:outer membrane beta-barrel protein [Chitinophaga barathri]RPD38372.1 hypothetical protein EG028_24165 [Chitinophaga barathri]